MLLVLTVLLKTTKGQVRRQ